METRTIPIIYALLAAVFYAINTPLSTVSYTHLNVVLSLDFIVGSLPFTYKNHGEYTASAVITSIIMLVLLMKGVFYEPVTTVISGIALGLIVSLIVKLLNRETGVKFNKVPAGKEDELTKQIYEILKKYGVKNLSLIHILRQGTCGTFHT